MRDRLAKRATKKQVRKLIKKTMKELKNSFKEGDITCEGIMEACQRLRDDLHDFK